LVLKPFRGYAQFIWATRDIAEAAALVLLEGPNRHANKFYDITVPAPQSMNENARHFGRAMGKTI
jgi:uncharacterized protein YbjT (DUF2867 family)